MTKILSLLITVIATTLLLVACGGGDDPAPAPTATTKPSATAEPTEKPAATAIPATTAPAANGSDSSLEIGSRGDELYFDKDKLTAKAGSEVTVKFVNTAGALQHNWVLVPTGTETEIAMAGTTAGADNAWIPDDPRIIAESPLVDPGESAAVTFTAPAAGSYTYVCTFPGHNFTMLGTFETN